MFFNKKRENRKIFFIDRYGKCYCKILLFCVIFYKNVKNQNLKIYNMLMDNEKTKLSKNDIVVAVIRKYEKF